jgi:hypothetical protein
MQHMRRLGQSPLQEPNTHGDQGQDIAMRYVVEWNGDKETIEVCEVEFSNEKFPDSSAEEAMSAMVRGLETTSTFGLYSFRRLDV